MAGMLRDSIVVVMRMRPRAIPLAMITTKKSLHGFPLISHDAYGAQFHGHSGCGAPLLCLEFKLDLLPGFFHRGSIVLHWICISRSNVF